MRRHQQDRGCSEHFPCSASRLQDTGHVTQQESHKGPNATGKARAEQHAEITAVGEQQEQPNVTTEPLDVQGHIPEMDDLCKEAAAKDVTMKTLVHPKNCGDCTRGLTF